MTDYSYVGSGKIHIREKGSANPFVEMGNCSALNLQTEENELELQDFTQPGGGTYNSVTRISAVRLAITAHDLSPENLARALYGSSTDVAAGTATDETVVAYKGGFTPLAKVPTAITSVEPAGGGTAYTVGSDYELRDGGIYIPASSTITAPVAGAPNIQVTYTYAKHDVVQALVSSPKEYDLVFVGLNEARSGKPFRVTVHRAKLGASRDLGLIGSQYAAIEITGRCLKDTAITTPGLSQYFKADLVE
jgi:hypothetical protein